MIDFALVTRSGCHLCDVMAAELERELGPEGAAWRSVDVDADAELRERFGEVVPVLLRDGVPVAKVRFEPGQLERVVRRKRG